MKNILSIEVKKSMNSLSFKLSFGVIFSVCMYQYIFICQYYEGDYLRQVRSAYELTIMTGTRTGFLMGILVGLMPLLACLIYSDSYVHDRKSNVLTSIVTRISMKTYLTAKGIAVFTATFCAFFIPLFINQLLILVTFPQKGISNKFASPTFDIGYTNYVADYLFDLIRIEHPMVYNLIFIVTLSLFAGLISLIGLVISFMFSKNRFIPVIAPFILYTFTAIGISRLGLYKYLIHTYLTPGEIGDVFHLIGLITALFLLIVVLYRRHLQKDIL